MRRREFITLLGGTAFAWPLAARAQRSDKATVGRLLMSTAADDPLSKGRYTAFVQGLQELEWVSGRNVRVEVRWTGGSAEHARPLAAELVALVPDVIMTIGAPSRRAVLYRTFS